MLLSDTCSSCMSRKWLLLNESFIKRIHIYDFCLCVQVVKDAGIEEPDRYSQISVYSCGGNMRCIGFHADLEEYESNCNSKFIFNMDQTLVFSSLTASKLWRWSVQIQSTSTHPNRTQDRQLSQWLCAAKLSLILIFTGTQNGRIVAKEFPMFPFGLENVWMD